MTSLHKKKGQQFSQSTWAAFLRHCKCLGSDMTLKSRFGNIWRPGAAGMTVPDVDLIFIKKLKEHGGRYMPFPVFVEALLEVAKLRYGLAGPDDDRRHAISVAGDAASMVAFDRLLEDCIFANGNRYLNMAQGVQPKHDSSAVIRQKSEIGAEGSRSTVLSGIFAESQSVDAVGVSTTTGLTNAAVQRLQQLNDFAFQQLTPHPAKQPQPSNLWRMSAADSCEDNIGVVARVLRACGGHDAWKRVFLYHRQVT